MSVVKGTFVFGSAQRANPFPGSLLFKPAELSDDHVIVVPQHDAIAQSIDEVELTGRYLDSTLRGMKVFEAISVRVLRPVTSDHFFTPNVSDVSEQITGTITFLSQCFKLKTGPTVFMTLERIISSHNHSQNGNQSTKQEIRLLLLQEAVQCAQYLCVGDNIQASNVTRFRWKAASPEGLLSQSSHSVYSVSGAGSVSSTQDEGSVGQGIKSYYVDKAETVVVLQHFVRTLPYRLKSNAVVNSSVHNTNTINTTVNTNTNTTTIDPASFTTPSTLLQKEVYASTELDNVLGTVRNVHPSGWIELVNVSVSYGGDHGSGSSSGSSDSTGSADHSGSSMDIYDVDSYPENSQYNTNNSTYATTNSPTTTYTTSLPFLIVYVSQYTVQHLRMTAIGVSVRKTAIIQIQHTIPVYMYGTLKGITTTCRSNMHVIKFANNTNFSSKEPMYCSVSVNICSEYKSNCVLYAVWREEIHRKLALCTNCVVCGELQTSILRHIESLASLNSRSSGASSGSSNTGAHSDISSGPGNIRTLLQLGPIAVQDEIYDLNTILLHTIRNGFDNDYIGNNMPQLYSVGSIIAKLKSIHVHNEGYCHSDVYGVYAYDICSVQLNNSYWTQYSGSKVSSVRKNIVLLGSVLRVCIPDTAYQNVCSVLSVSITIVDAGGCCVEVIVSGVNMTYIQYLHTLCAAHMHKANHSCSKCDVCGRYRPAFTNSSTIPHTTHTIHTNYYTLCTCTVALSSPLHTKPSINTTCVVINPLLISIHYPQALVEKQPLTSNSTNIASSSDCSGRSDSYRYFITADKDSVKFIHNTNTATTTVPTTSNTNGTTPAAHSTHTPHTTPISVRTLLSMNLAHYKHKYIPALYCVVVNKQMLSVEYKNRANNDINTTNTTLNNHDSPHKSQLSSQDTTIKLKRRRLETQYSVCEEMEYGDKLNNTTSNGGSSGINACDSGGVIGLYSSNMMYEKTLTYSATHANATYNTPYHTTNHTSPITTHSTTHSTTNTTGAIHTNTNNTNTNTNTNTTHNTTTNNKKCCLTIRDVHYPDTINLYIPPSLINKVIVGNIVVITDLFACIPESKKKMYLKVAEEHKTHIDVLGMVTGTQLHTLCDHSRTIPDPRYVDTMYTTLCSSGSTSAGHSGNTSGGSAGSGASGVVYGNMSTATYQKLKHNIMPYTKQRIYEHYIHTPPTTTISSLTPLCTYNRAVHTLHGQVTYIRKLHVTLRCTNCNSGVRKTTRLGGYQCAKCTSIYTIKPLWEVYIAFDDGTGECNMHVEGEQVYTLIRARYDLCSSVLVKVRKLVDEYVCKYGSLMYDAFDISVSEYNKPYSEVIGERQNIVDLTTTNTTNTTNINRPHTGDPNNATTNTTQYNTRTNPIFDIPLSERTKKLVAHIDLITNNTNAKIPLILRSYIQLVSYSTQYSVYCRVDFNTHTITNTSTSCATNTTTSNTTTNATTNTTSTNNITNTTNTTKAKREIKLQRNNAEKPYLAYFVSRPTFSGAKLSVTGLYVRELHSEGLNSVSWDLVRKLQK